MKKNRKTVIGIVTLITIFMTCITPAYATDSETQTLETEDIQVILSNEENGERTEISVCDGTYMYYNDVNGCVVSINIYPNGYIDIAKNDKNLDYVEGVVIDNTLENSIEIFNCGDKNLSPTVTDMDLVDESEVLRTFEKNKR